MAIPEFCDGYYLPPGEHDASLQEVYERFGCINDIRERVWKKFDFMLSRFSEIHLPLEKVLIDGSFVTNRAEPGDVDAAILIRPHILITVLSCTADEHDQDALKLFSNPQNATAIRAIMGAHVIPAPDETVMNELSSFFRHGIPHQGGLRDPDRTRDPDWVKKPLEKGIINVCHL